MRTLKRNTAAQNVRTAGVENPTKVRIFVEDANGLNSLGGGNGHRYIDVTDKPMPTIQAGRPVRYYLEIVE